MKITVAGAGAGKTTKMADYIRQCNAAPGKIVFCIAFTNAAVDNIRKKMGGDKKDIPTNISICTIHSFLYEEFIDPYNYLLYGKHYKGISVINLPAEVAFKNKKIRELEDEDLLHISLIPERAKWIVDKKSKDTAKIKSKRQEVLSKYLIARTSKLPATYEIIDRIEMLSFRNSSFSIYPISHRRPIQWIHSSLQKMFVSIR